MASSTKRGNGQRQLQLSRVIMLTVVWHLAHGALTLTHLLGHMSFLRPIARATHADTKETMWVSNWAQAWGRLDDRQSDQRTGGQLSLAALRIGSPFVAPIEKCRPCHRCCRFTDTNLVPFLSRAPSRMQLSVICNV